MLGIGVVISFRMGKLRKQYLDRCGLSSSLSVASPFCPFPTDN